MKYRVTFRARSSSSRPIAAEVCHNDPWRGYGSAQLDLAEQWKDCQLTFTAPEDDDNARLTFQFGQTTGTVWIADVSLHESPVFGLRKDESPADGTVRRLDPAEFGSATDERFRDEGRFYLELERRYYEAMRQFLRVVLKVRALLQGPTKTTGCPALKRRRPSI